MRGNNRTFGDAVILEMVDVPDNLSQHVLGAAGVVGAVALVICTLGLGWYVVWCTSLRDLPIAQEIMGKRRQTQAQKDQIAKEIREIKRQHSRRGPSMDLIRQTSLTRQVNIERTLQLTVCPKTCGVMEVPHCLQASLSRQLNQRTPERSPASQKSH